MTPEKLIPIMTPLLALPLAAAAQQARPNIVVMIADDCTYRDLGCYGSVNSTTPNIDRLASEGMRFTNFYQAAPMSSPTRQCLMTGVYPVRNGAYPNHARVTNPDVLSVVQHMKAEGYRVALQGKRHFSPLELFDYEFLSGENMDVNPGKIRPFLEDVKASGEPFVLFICSHQPHTPWNMGDRDAIDPDKLVLPEYFVDTPETRTDFRNYLAEVNYMDGQVGAVDKLLEETGFKDNTVFFFTSEQGNSFPFAKWTLYDMGIHTGMIVRWPGVIPAGCTSDALAEYVDMVPTMIDIAGGDPSGKDLDGRSFLKVLKGETKKHKSEVYAVHTTRGIIHGVEGYGIRSVRDERYTYIRNLTPDALFRCEFINLSKPTWSSWVKAATTDERAANLVTRYQKRPAEELYDRKNDPDMLHNLAGTRKVAKIQKRLSAKLDAWMEAQGDKGAQTELEAFEHQNLGQKGAQEKFNAAYRGPMMLADPFIIEVDGIYYAYGTGSPDGILVYRSIDLEHWDGPCGNVGGGLALSKKDSQAARNFWAPEVYRMDDGKYAMVYSAETRIRIAFSDSPMGPFTGEVTYTPDQNSIDNHIFVDDDGQAYMYWVRFGLGKGNEIRVAKLSADWKSIVSEQIECLHAELGWETKLGLVTEGPFILKHAGKYYLTYSANDFKSKDYAVGYAVSDSPLGPWRRYEGNPVMVRPQGLPGSGHHAFFTNHAGDTYVVYHVHFSDEKVAPRRTMISPYRFEGPAGSEPVLVIDTEFIIKPIIY